MNCERVSEQRVGECMIAEIEYSWSGVAWCDM